MFKWLKQLFEESEDAKLKRLLSAHASSLSEVARLVATDAEDRSTLGGFGSKARIREIGESLNEAGGMELMRAAYYDIKGRGPYFSEDIWDGIGDWRC